MSQLVKAWWCGPANGCLARPLEGESEPRRIVVGETLRVPPPISVCERGLHASRRLLDALNYTPADTICLYRVEVGGKVKEEGDKFAAETRTALAKLEAEDAERELRLFACDAAEYAFAIVRKRGQEPDPRSVAAVTVARSYATGAATKDELAAASDAARAAARDAARAAAWAAARDAAWAAAWAAAWDAAWAAAWDAAWGAARAAARDAARDALNGMLEERILTAMGLPVPTESEATP